MDGYYANETILESNDFCFVFLFSWRDGGGADTNKTFSSFFWFFGFAFRRDCIVERRCIFESHLVSFPQLSDEHLVPYWNAPFVVPPTEKKNEAKIIGL